MKSSSSYNTTEQDKQSIYMESQSTTLQKSGNAKKVPPVKQSNIMKEQRIKQKQKLNRVIFTEQTQQKNDQFSIQKMKNRESAQKSRDQKKAYLIQIQEQYKNLESNYCNLKQEYDQLREEHLKHLQVCQFNQKTNHLNLHDNFFQDDNVADKKHYGSNIFDFQYFPNKEQGGDDQDIYFSQCSRVKNTHQSGFISDASKLLISFAAIIALVCVMTPAVQNSDGSSNSNMVVTARGHENYNDPSTSYKKLNSQPTSPSKLPQDSNQTFEGIRMQFQPFYLPENPEQQQNSTINTSKIAATDKGQLVPLDKYEHPLSHFFKQNQSFEGIKQCFDNDVFNISSPFQKTPWDLDIDNQNFVYYEVENEHNLDEEKEEEVKIQAKFLEKQNTPPVHQDQKNQPAKKFQGEYGIYCPVPIRFNFDLSQQMNPNQDFQLIIDSKSIVDFAKQGESYIQKDLRDQISQFQAQHQESKLYEITSRIIDIKEHNPSPCLFKAPTVV